MRTPISLLKCLQIGSIFTVMVAATCFNWAPLAASAEPIEIGSRRELFVVEFGGSKLSGKVVRRQLGDKVAAIPIHSILEVGETRKLAGQSQWKRMLRVDFRNHKGETDAIAWGVKERERWQKEILSLTKR